MAITSAAVSVASVAALIERTSLPAMSGAAIIAHLHATRGARCSMLSAVLLYAFSTAVVLDASSSCCLEPRFYAAHRLKCERSSVSLMPLPTSSMSGIT